MHHVDRRVRLLQRHAAARAVRVALRPDVVIARVLEVVEPHLGARRDVIRAHFSFGVLAFLAGFLFKRGLDDVLAAARHAVDENILDRSARARRLKVAQTRLRPIAPRKVGGPLARMSIEIRAGRHRSEHADLEDRVALIRRLVGTELGVAAARARIFDGRDGRIRVKFPHHGDAVPGRARVADAVLAFGVAVRPDPVACVPPRRREIIMARG